MKFLYIVLALALSSSVSAGPPLPLALAKSQDTTSSATPPAITSATSGKNKATTSTKSSTGKTSSADPPATTSTNDTAGGGTSGGDTSDPQKSFTLDPEVIATGFANDGQDVPVAGQVASLTSSNNFINFCLTSNKPIGNGKQVQTGSCNPAPMGIIAATTNMPSSKFVFPANGAVVPANKAFTIQMAIKHLTTGNFVNAASNYFSAPQQVDGSGDIIGHSHVVVEKLASLDQTDPTDPSKFAFFKGLNAAANDGILTADVTKGLAPGAYRLASINSAANHQPVLVAIAQHGSLDDMVYFTVGN